MTLTFCEQLAVREAADRVRRTPDTHRHTVAARTEISLLLGRSKSARRTALVRMALETAAE